PAIAPHDSDRWPWKGSVHRELNSSTAKKSGIGAASAAQASFSHLSMKLFLAAPASGLPSELTALGSHASRLHFFRKLLSAAPASAFPFLSTALLAQVAPCESAGPAASATTMAAKRIRFIVFLLINPI